MPLGWRSNSQVVEGEPVVTESLGQIGRMSARPRFGMVAAAGLAAAMLMTGCAAGQHAQTSNQTPAIDGVGADSGQIGIRAAAIAAPETGPNFPAGSDATLKLVMVNSGTSTVALAAVSTTAAQHVTLGLNGPAETANTSTSTGATTIAIPSSGTVQVGFSALGPTITLSHLNQTLYPAQSVPVVFTFTNGAKISTTLPVQITSNPPDAPTVNVSPPEAAG
jgi:hypothetical protein